MSSEWPWGRDRLDVQAADLQCPADDRQPDLVLVLDVVGMRVGAQDVGRLDAPLRRRPQQRLQRGPRIHEDGRAALLVRDQIGVREETVIHAPCHQHVVRLTVQPEARRKQRCPA
jgi:hypothetical protein